MKARSVMLVYLCYNRSAKKDYQNTEVRKMVIMISLFPMNKVCHKLEEITYNRFG